MPVDVSIIMSLLNAPQEDSGSEAWEEVFFLDSIQEKTDLIATSVTSVFLLRMLDGFLQHIQMTTQPAHSNYSIGLFLDQTSKCLWK